MSKWEKFLEFFGCKPTKAKGFDGVSFTARCVRCDRRILQDSQGGWFPASDQKEELDGK